ncbi:MAG: sigma-70 family RNA polymerase sigma factor [Gemmatimonadota bacterium]
MAERVDADDVARLFAEHHPSLYRYLYRLTGDADAAADAAQEAFTRMVADPPANEMPRAWLFKVATNLVRDRARVRRRRRELLEDRPDRAPVGDPPPDPETALMREDARARVRRALDALDDKERTVLLMREEGFRHREIAAAVGTTTGSVGTMIARALDKLARRLDADNAEGER